MQSIKELAIKIHENTQEKNKISLGYPGNRKHIFDIDKNLLGIKENSIIDTFFNNIGTPHDAPDGLTHTTKHIELVLLKILADHYKIDKKHLFGYVTSGGTEANFTSIWWHRDFLKNKYNETPTLISSKSSHYSIDKICNQLAVQNVKINTHNHEINLEHLEDTIKNTKTPVIMIVNIGSTTHGAIDNLLEIKNILEKYKPVAYKIHGDGAVYGIITPYLEQFKQINHIFEYLDSLSFSGHKFLGTNNICGMVLTKKDYIMKIFNDTSRISYVKNILDCTFSGSRSGISVLELALLIEECMKLENGTPKLQLTWQKCLDNACWFYEELKQIVGTNSLLEYIEGQISVVIPALKSKDLLNKYTLMPINNGNQWGLYTLPSKTRELLSLFLEEYKNSY
jgi:histidine decarboxylase